jgi:hypothetical protein
MFPRTPSHSFALALIVAASLALLAPAAVRAAGSDYSGRYEATEVVEGDQIVSLTLALSVVSHRSEEITGATVSLLDASDAGVVYARFPALAFSPGVDVPLTATVSLERSEWDRWRSGAPPRVRLEAYDVDGTDLSAMVELVQISSPEVLQ